MYYLFKKWKTQIGSELQDRRISVSFPFGKDIYFSSKASIRIWGSPNPLLKWEPGVKRPGE